MRNIALCLGPLLAAGLLFACEDDTSNGGGDTFDPDSGTYQPPPTTTPTSDAGSDAATHDAGDGDADAGPLPLTVTVMRGNGPAVGVEIVFHDEAGAVIGTAKTDAAGKVVNTGPVPAQVSALLGGGSHRRIHTWTGVEDHDQLFVADPYSDAGQDATGRYDVTLPGKFQDANRYKLLAGPCSGMTETQDAPESVQLFLRLKCQRPQVSILARAFDDVASQTAFAFKKGNAAVADGSTVPVTLSSWAAPGTTSVDAKNIPDDWVGYGSLLEIEGGLGFFTDENILLANNQSVTVDVANGFAEAHQFTGALMNDMRRTSITKRSSSTATSTMLDFGSMLPEISEVEIDSADAVRPTASWTPANPLTGTDGGGVLLQWIDNRPRDFVWTFTVAPGAGSVKAPAMPTDAADWLPDDGSEFGEPEVFFLEADAFTGYAQFRSEAARIIPMADLYDLNRIDQIVLPQDGTLRATSHVFIQPR